MWSQQFSAKIYSKLKAFLVIPLLAILMGNTLNYNYNSAITNKNSNHYIKSCFPKAIFYGHWFLTHNDQKASIEKEKLKFIYIVCFIINVI